MKTFSDLPRREQKAARTRVALVDALAQRLATRTLEQIAVAELAEAADISQATFFNYFANKGELLTFFIQVWSVQMAALARSVEAEHDSALASIEALFAHTAEISAQSPRLMLEIIAHQARMPEDLVPPGVDRAVRMLRLPGEPDVEELPDTGLGGILPVWVERAVRLGELPAHTSVPEATMALAAIFLGSPLVLGLKNAPGLGALYQSQLKTLWAGLHGAGVHTTDAT